MPEAVQWYGKALELDPMRAVAYLNLGDAYFQMEKKGEAAKAYEKYLSMQPNSSRAAELKEKIDAAR